MSVHLYIEINEMSRVTWINAEKSRESNQYRDETHVIEINVRLCWNQSNRYRDENQINIEMRHVDMSV